MGYAILPLRRELPRCYNYAKPEMIVDATDELPVPEAEFLFSGHIYRNEYLATDARPPVFPLVFSDIFSAVSRTSNITQ
jgi:hypothetical protein